MTLEIPIPFDRPYLLVTNIPCFVDGAGAIHLDRLWRRDFLAHLTYLPRLVCAAPFVAKPADRADLVPITPDEFQPSRFVRLPAQRSTLAAFFALPVTAARIWRAVGGADVVHCGVGGWPFPLGWIAAASARIRRRRLLVVVESATWRLTESARSPGVADRVRAATYEAGARACCRSATLCIYTQPFYRDAFPPGPRGCGVVAPATWIDEADVLDDAAAGRSWDAKSGGPVRFLFAGRMTADKGVNVLIEALRSLDARGLPVEVDAVGVGELRPAFEAAARSLAGVRLRVLEPAPYGAPFFAMIDRYHALLVPSIGDEQPRIVFDAAARAAPVVASDTDGLRSIVRHGETGRIVPRGDAAALAAEIEGLSRHADLLRSLGMAAVRDVRGRTHAAMHAARSRVIAERLGGPSRIATPAAAGAP